MVTVTHSRTCLKRRVGDFLGHVSNSRIWIQSKYIRAQVGSARIVVSLSREWKSCLYRFEYWYCRAAEPTSVTSQAYQKHQRHVTLLIQQRFCVYIVTLLLLVLRSSNPSFDYLNLSSPALDSSIDMIYARFWEWDESEIEIDSLLRRFFVSEVRTQAGSWYAVTSWYVIKIYL